MTPPQAIDSSITIIVSSTKMGGVFPKIISVFYNPNMFLFVFYVYNADLAEVFRGWAPDLTDK